MEITWLGHGCFRLKGAALTLVTDPFDPSLGRDPGPLRGDVVTLSHQGTTHACPERVQGSRKVLRGPGEYEIAGVFILGVRPFRERRRAGERAPSTVYRIGMEGVTICHLGQIGEALTSDHASAIGDVDVLLVPVGGGSMLTARQASEVVGVLEPRLIVPMHYKTEDTPEPLDALEAFLKELGLADVTRAPKLAVTRSTLPAGPQVMVLERP